LRLGLGCDTPRLTFDFTARRVRSACHKCARSLARLRAFVMSGALPSGSHGGGRFGMLIVFVHLCALLVVVL
jgi:hypothetical protein